MCLDRAGSQEVVLLQNIGMKRGDTFEKMREKVAGGCWWTTLHYLSKDVHIFCLTFGAHPLDLVVRFGHVALYSDVVLLRKLPQPREQLIGARRNEARREHRLD